MARRDQSGQLGLLAIRDVMAEMVPREGTDKQAPQEGLAVMGGQEPMERQEALGLEAMWGTQDP